jgi:hypothetical protein
VVWRNLGGPLVYKMYRFPAPVLQAVWCSFAYSVSTRTHGPSLCVLSNAELVLVRITEGLAWHAIHDHKVARLACQSCQLITKLLAWHANSFGTVY